MMTYEKKVEYIKLLQQLKSSFMPVAETNHADEDPYVDRIGAKAYVCKAGKRALLVITPKALLEDDFDGLDYREEDVERDDFEGEEFFESRPQFLYRRIHEFDWEKLASTAFSELKNLYNYLDVSIWAPPQSTRDSDVIGLLSQLLNLKYIPKADHQFGPPSKILKAWLGEGVDYAMTPGFGYLDGKLFLFEGKVVRTGMFNGGWRGDQALADALNWLIKTECIDISAYKSLPFPENLRATMRAQDQEALQRQISAAEIAVRHAEAELAKKRQKLDDLYQRMNQKP